MVPHARLIRFSQSSGGYGYTYFLVLLRNINIDKLNVPSYMGEGNLGSGRHSSPGETRLPSVTRSGDEKMSDEADNQDITGTHLGSF